MLHNKNLINYNFVAHNGGANIGKVQLVIKCAAPFL